MRIEQCLSRMTALTWSMSLSLGLGIISSILTGADPGVSGLGGWLFGPVLICSAHDLPPFTDSVFVGHYLLRPNCFNPNNVVRLLRAPRANLKSRRDDLMVAQGKRGTSAALGYVVP